MQPDATTREIVDAFERCTLPSLSHEDHVRLAWHYVSRDDLATVLKEFPAKIRRYAESKGAPGLYHETITFSFVCLIHERVARGPECSWASFAKSNADLLDSSLLDRYYAKDVLESSEARRVFLLPRGS